MLLWQRTSGYSSCVLWQVASTLRQRYGYGKTKHAKRAALCRQGDESTAKYAKRAGVQNAGLCMRTIRAETHFAFASSPSTSTEHDLVDTKLERRFLERVAN